jgi:Tat protein secretion system quality control protein TatD with DNase activity
MQEDFVDQQESALKMLQDKKIFTIAASAWLEQYYQSMDLAKKSKNIIPAFGMFATYAKDFDPELHLSILRKAPILSEIGLSVMGDPPPDMQIMEDVFRIFLEHAEKARKIVICHTTSADEHALSIMDSYDLPGVVIHGFRTSHKMLNKIIGNNYYVSAGFLITDAFKESRDWELWRSIAKDIPMDLLLTETDGPSKRFDLNPSSVIEVVETLATLKKKNHIEIKEAVFKNFLNLLKKDHKLQNYRDFLAKK